jgi:hypothetical protein
MIMSHNQPQLPIQSQSAVAAAGWWTTTSIKSANLSGGGSDAITNCISGDLTFNASEVLIDGRSLKDFMDQVSRRLAILTPDPARLARYEALRQAYDHYLTLEALLLDEEK